jgi:hypothetical protein
MTRRQRTSDRPVAKSGSGTRKHFPYQLCRRGVRLRVSMEQGQELVCSVCNAPVKRTAPVGPPMGEHRVAHLRCWIRTRQGATEPVSERQPRRRRSRKWQRRSRRKRVILFTGRVVVFALAILAVLAFEWLVDVAVK